MTCLKQEFLEWDYTQKYKIWKFLMAAFGYENFKKTKI